MEYSNLFVVLMGLGTTFFGLTCIIFLIFLLGKLPGGEKPNNAPIPVPTAAVSAPAEDQERKKRVIAAITASLAHELDISPSGIRIMSIKKIK